MTEEYGTEAEDVIAAVGPSICQDCYEVSEDVIEKFKEAFDEIYWGELFYQKENNKYQLNLWKANEIILLEAGVPKENRATKGERGSLAAFMALK